MKIFEKFEQAKEKLETIEKQILNMDNFNIACELICKNNSSQNKEEIKGYNIEQIADVGCENIRKDINSIIDF